MSIKTTREQAQGFMNAIRPCGEMSNIDTPIFHYLSGLIGHVPESLPLYANPSDNQIELAKRLKEIAFYLETPFDKIIERGEGEFERDSVVFHEAEYVWPVLSALMSAAARAGGKLHVVDFGG